MREQLELRTEMEDMTYFASVLNSYTKDFNFLPDQRRDNFLPDQRRDNFLPDQRRDKVHSLLRGNIATVTLKTLIKKRKAR